jgi:hypothetical protein
MSAAYTNRYVRMWPIAAFRDEAKFGRFRSLGDMDRQAKPAGSVENDLACVKTQKFEGPEK